MKGNLQWALKLHYVFKTLVHCLRSSAFLFISSDEGFRFNTLEKNIIYEFFYREKLQQILWILFSSNNKNLLIEKMLKSKLIPVYKYFNEILYELIAKELITQSGYISTIYHKKSFGINFKIPVKSENKRILLQIFKPKT